MPWPYIEYSPSRVQCQTYTAAPCLAEPSEASTIFIEIVSGTPSAVPFAEPKLERMSLRTMPLWVNTLGPFEPSPGYGPAVSSGISPTDALDAAAVVVVDEPVVEESVVDEPVVDEADV